MADYPDYEGGKAGIYLIPEWAAFEATDKNFTASAINVARLGAAFVNYVVPAGKTLYITTASFSNRANLAADADKNQMCDLIIQDGAVSVFYQGANGGGNVSLSKPLVFDAGSSVSFYIYNQANHNTVVALVAGGYEI